MYVVNALRFCPKLAEVKLYKELPLLNDEVIVVDAVKSELKEKIAVSPIVEFIVNEFKLKLDAPLDVWKVIANVVNTFELAVLVPPIRLRASPVTSARDDPARHVKQTSKPKILRIVIPSSWVNTGPIYRQSSFALDWFILKD